MTDLELKAKAFATKCHEDIKQVRKYTGEPYINHPAAVVEIVRSVPHTEAMLCAAWLHDTVEDTNATTTLSLLINPPHFIAKPPRFLTLAQQR